MAQRIYREATPECRKKQSEAMVLKCLNEHIVVTDILEMHIDIALYIILYFHKVHHWSYIDMTYRSLTDEFNVATVF